MTNHHHLPLLMIVLDSKLNYFSNSVHILFLSLFLYGQWWCCCSMLLLLMLFSLYVFTLCYFDDRGNRCILLPLHAATIYCIICYKHLVSVFRSDTSRSSTPSGYSGSFQISFNSSGMEELNRTWPSASASDASAINSRLGSPRSAISVSAAKSHFEQISKSR